MRGANRTPQPGARTDTTRKSAELQMDSLRRLTPERRLELAVDMSLAVRALQRARLREAHPAWSSRDLDIAILRSTLPDTTSLPVQ